MSEPLVPWRDAPPETGDALEQRAAALVQQAHALGPRPVELSAGWDAVLLRATSRRSSRSSLVLAGLVSMLVGVVATSAVLRAREPVVRASSGTQWAQRTDGAVQLQAGRVEMTRPTSVRIESPQVTIWARECRFAAEVITEGTRVTVFEGTALVRSGAGDERTLGPGEEALWPAAPVISPALALHAEPTPGLPCSDAACMQRTAGGAGLEAELALFELGRQQALAGEAEQALLTWRRSLTRFPGGVFEPEVRLSLLVTLTQARRFGEAVEVARAFEAGQPGDPRLDDVRALRQQLEWLTTAR